MKITLPLPPNMANARMNWAVKNRKRVNYFEACDIAALLSAKGGEHDPKKWAAPEVTLVRVRVYCGALHDEDNLLARLKFPVDWMVRRAYLKGDSPKYLKWDWPIQQIVKRDQQYRVEFELEAA